MSLKAAEFTSDLNATRPYYPPQSHDEHLLMRHVEDLYKVSSNRGIGRATGFLNDRQQQLCIAQLNRHNDIQYTLYGGFPFCERKVLYLNLQQDEMEADICLLQIIPDEFRPDFNHQAVLGSLLGLEITRDAVGDIHFHSDENYAIVAVKSRLSGILLDDLRYVGRHSVKVCPLSDDPAKIQNSIQGLNLQTASVSSLRVDSVLSAMLNVSRSVSEAMIHSGFVEVNHILVKNAHDRAYAGDIYSVRGKGKFCLEQVKGLSKKGRLFIEYYKY